MKAIDVDAGDREDLTSELEYESDDETASGGYEPSSRCIDTVGFDTSQIEPASVSVVHSSDVQIGNRLHYNGPVVINQFVNSTPATAAELEDRALNAANQGLGNVDTVHSTPPKVFTICGQSGLTPTISEKLCSRTVLKLALLVTVSVALTGAILGVTLTKKDTSTLRPQHRFTDPPPVLPPPEEENPNTTLPDGHKIISKVEWGGRPADHEQKRFALLHPTPYVIVSHTAGQTCFSSNKCASICRNIQDDNMGGVFHSADIVCNFLVGGDGNVYEGRGWDVTNPRSGLAGVLLRNNIDICMIGNFVYDKPTEVQLNATTALLDLGVRLQKLDVDYKLLSHNDTSATLSPGHNIFVHIREWPHFYVPGT